MWSVKDTSHLLNGIAECTFPLLHPTSWFPSIRDKVSKMSHAVFYDSNNNNWDVLVHYIESRYPLHRYSIYCFLKKWPFLLAFKNLDMKWNIHCKATLHCICVTIQPSPSGNVYTPPHSKKSTIWHPGSFEVVEKEPHYRRGPHWEGALLPDTVKWQ